jgi:hypothetical protein
MYIGVFWDVTSCIVVRTGVSKLPTACIIMAEGGTRFLRNVGTYLLHSVVHKKVTLIGTAVRTSYHTYNNVVWKQRVEGNVWIYKREKVTDWKTLHNEQLHSFPLHGILIRRSKWRIIRRTRHLARMEGQSAHAKYCPDTWIEQHNSEFVQEDTAEQQAPENAK